MRLTCLCISLHFPARAGERAKKSVFVRVGVWGGGCVVVCGGGALSVWWCVVAVR